MSRRRGINTHAHRGDPVRLSLSPPIDTDTGDYRARVHVRRIVYLGRKKKRREKKRKTSKRGETRVVDRVYSRTLQLAVFAPDNWPRPLAGEDSWKILMRTRGEPALPGRRVLTSLAGRVALLRNANWSSGRVSAFSFLLLAPDRHRMVPRMVDGVAARTRRGEARQGEAFSSSAAH